MSTGPDVDDSHCDQRLDNLKIREEISSRPGFQNVSREVFDRKASSGKPRYVFISIADQEFSPSDDVILK